MAGVEVCVFCDVLLSEYPVNTVGKLGLETIRKCCVRRKDGKDALFAGLESLTVHKKCWKSYTNEKSVSAAERGTSRARANPAPINVPVDAVPQVARVDFSFEDHCIFCDEEITDAFKQSEKKKPIEKRIVVSTVISEHTKASIEQVARKYPSEWSTKVLNRIEGVDLVACKAQYHRPCYKRFGTISRGHWSGHIGRPKSDAVASKMALIIKYIEENKDQCQFTIAELRKVIDDPPSDPTIKDKLKEYFGTKNVVIQSKTGHHTLIWIRNHQELLDSWYHNKLPDTKRERARIVDQAGAIILEDIQTAQYDTTYYPSPDKFLDSAEKDVPDTLNRILNKIILTNKNNSTDVYAKQCTAIAHWIIAACRPRTFASCLQIGLSAYLNSRFGSKNLIQVLSTLGCCSSYSETEILELSAILHPEEEAPKGFLQFVADNADVNSCTLDGRGTFHSMGMIQCVTPTPVSSLSKKISRVTGVFGRQVLRNTPQVPLQTFERNHREKGLAAVTVEMVGNDDSISLRVADLLFMYAKFKDIPRIPGWNGFMEKLKSYNSYAVSNIVTLPFINAPPSDYNTIFTTLLAAAERAQKANQKSCLVTFDQPLFQKARDIVASSTDPRLESVIVRLGGMHLLMSFMGCIGFVMAGSGLKEVLSLIYAPVSVDKMMNGHAYTRAVRGHMLTQLALGRIILSKLDFSLDEEMEIEDLLEHFDSGTAEERMKDGTFEVICQRFEDELQKQEANGPTAALWIQYFRMVILVKQFIEAERSGNWQLHLTTIAKMLPFFHAAGHNNYALSAHLYLQDMKDLKQKMGLRNYHDFVSRGYFTIRRSDKFWSGIWSDMTIKQTLMRSMKSTGGLTRGRGLTDSVLTKWILGMPVMQKVSESIEDFVGIKSSSSEQHVDARPTRQNKDNADVDTLLKWFENHDPFPVSNRIVSLSTGVVGGEEINCHKAQAIGMEGLKAIVGKNFAELSFSRKKRVLPLSAVTSSLKINDAVVPVDPMLLFQRISFAKESQDQFKGFFAFELAPYPLSLFEESGMRKSKKSALYDLFNPTDDDVTSGDVGFVIDGGYLLHKVVWQKGDTYSEICKKYVDYIRSHYGDHVTVVFDGYPENVTDRSTKTAERLRRAKSLSVDVFIVESTSQDKFLSNDKNKARLITLLMSKLQRQGYKVVQSTEDADTLIVDSALNLSSDYENVIIVGEDVDLLVILTGMEDQRRENVYFMKPGKGKTKKFVYSSDSLKDQTLTPYILTCHAFTGCDTTSSLFNRGKKGLTSLVSKHQDIRLALDCFKVANADPQTIADAGEKILVRMYGGKPPQCLNDMRYEGFARSITKSKFNIAGLPPTKAAAAQHSYRVYHQVQQWRRRNVPATLWGWTQSPNGLTPTLTTQDPAPAELLKLVSCKCEKGCGKVCGCRKAGLKCSEICQSCHGQNCTNIKTLEVEEMEDDLEIDSVQESLLNAETDQFGEPQDVVLNAEDTEAEPDEEEFTNDETNDEPLSDPSSPGPSTRKKRRINHHEEVMNADCNEEAT